MSDARLRALERRWRSTGAPEDEVAWLRGRLRAGALPTDRLRLAADLGHLPALGALGRSMRRRRAPFQRWALALLDGWDQEVALRALQAIVAARHDAQSFAEALLEDGVEALLEPEAYYLTFYAAAMELGDDATRAAVASALVPWALGTSDPLPDPPWRATPAPRARRGPRRRSSSR